MSSTSEPVGSKSFDSDMSTQHRAPLAPRETLRARLRRCAMGLVWSARPNRIAGAPATLAMVLSHWFGELGDAAPERQLPDPAAARDMPDGLAGICSSLEPDVLLAAYTKGLFPWCHVGPMKWWAPAKRMALAFENFHIEKNLRRRLRNNHFRVTFDQDFAGVISGCAEPRAGKFQLTWITPRVIDAFSRLHELGHAHSVEVWNDQNELVGGLYGLAVGGVFFTESQFARARDASKVGFATLNCHLQRWGFALNDGKLPTAHLTQLGFELVDRDRFNAILAEHCAREIPRGPWRLDPELDVGAWDPAAPAWLDAETDA